MPLFSIIIPIYNVENYLHQCVDSILAQDFEDYEIILVDDGSPDNCPKICDEYAEKDKKTKVIHKKNGGLSDARNIGITEAIGDYIIFVDSDDYWEGTNNLKLLSEAVQENNPDVVFYGTKDLNLKTGSSVISRGNYDKNKIKISKESAIKSLINTAEFPGSAWVMMVKKSMIDQHDIRFIKGLKAEDIDWILRVFTHANTFNAVNQPFYMYVKNRPGSITNTSDLKSAKDILFTVKKWFEKLEKDSSTISKNLLSYLAYQYLTSFIIYTKLSKEDRKHLYPLVYNQKEIIKYLHGFKGKLAKILINNIGIEKSAVLFKFIHDFNGIFPQVKSFMR